MRERFQVKNRYCDTVVEIKERMGFRKHGGTRVKIPHN